MMFCMQCSEKVVENLDVVSKIRETYKYTYEVTPASRHCLTYDEESWKPTTEEEQQDLKCISDTDHCRTLEIRQSKTKRVRNYLKKCKNVLSRSSSSDQAQFAESSSSSSWYIEKQISGVLNESEVVELEDVFEDAKEIGGISEICEKANVVEVRGRSEEAAESCKDEKEKATEISSPTLTETQSEVVGDDSGTINDTEQLEVVNSNQEGKANAKQDVAGLVDRYFSSLYINYHFTKKCLIRQARDLFVCEYHGCLKRFEDEFCIPAAKLLQHLKDKYSSYNCAPTGWPLCVGPSGIVVHLSPLDPSLVRNNDCYICLRNRSAPGLEIALIWRKSADIHCHTLGEFKNPLKNLDDIMCSTLNSPIDLDFVSDGLQPDNVELPELLQNLLVSVEHAIERVPLDDLTFPCPQCLKYLPLDRPEDESDSKKCACQCTCRLPGTTVTKKDTSIQTSPMFEFAGSIPHIDSDEEEDKESIKSGSGKKIQEITRPSRITDLPEKLLMSGINLPGTVDQDGRPIVLCYAECISRAGLNKYEVARLLLYYATIPKSESADKGFTILLVAENDDYNQALELLDKTACLLGNHIKIAKILVWRPGTTTTQKRILSSRIQVVFVNDENSLYTSIIKDQAPASCGGLCNHDQLEWVEFFKQLEPFLESCRTVGRALLCTLSQLRNEEVPSQITRRFLNHQCRQISKAVQLECLQKLRKEGKATLENLEERTHWLSSSKDVKRNASMAHDSFSSVDRISQRLEQLAQERRERLKELARLRTLQDEADELLSWIRKVGEETINSQTILLRSATDVAGVKTIEKSFENFYFNALRQIDKASDLVEEANSIKDVKGQSLKESSKNLKIQIKVFSERLEEIRERLEDTSRCYLLLESCQDILVDDNKEREDFKKLAFRSGNEKLIHLCKNATKHICNADPDRDKKRLPAHVMYSATELSATSTPVKVQNAQIRRRSVSSHAYIYHCNHHAAGEQCNCCESDTENTVSYKLKKKYIQTLQGCGCSTISKDSSKNSVLLGGIKEEHESMENLLDKIDKSDSECGPCDSGISTTDNSVGEDTLCRKKLQRMCSCVYYRESCALCCTGSSSAGSNQDQNENDPDNVTEEGSDGFIKSSSSDDIEELHYSEERRKVPPVTANSHLYCHASTLHIPSEALYSNMDPKTQKTLLLIMREMIQTERDYVRSLDYIIENYIPELMREDIPQALRGQRNVVFGNVEKIYEFHSQHFLRELEQCENNPLQIGQIFLKYDKKFYLYALYNKNKPKSDSLMSEYGSAFFKSKQLELGDKMDLASYLLKPVQRMGKYALLLQQMMKACPFLPPGASERAITEADDLKQAEEMVRFQLRHGNDLLAMDSIRECDVNLKEQGRLIRQNEFLVWEGRSGKKSLRQVFLFEELILFSKARRFPDRKNLDLYIYKNSIKMTDIGLTAKIGDSPTKFEIWFRKRKPNDTFTLQSISEDVKKAWTEELSQLLWKQAIRNREVRMAEMSSMGIGNKPCLDIRPNADQINDRSISFAQLTRKHSFTRAIMEKLRKQYEIISNTYSPSTSGNCCRMSHENTLSHAVPRFRNSIAGPIMDSCRSSKRPHSVISMSSVSSGSTSSGGSGGNTPNPSTLMNLNFETSCDSPKSYHRSGTLNSQCSIESGIIADISVASDECSEHLHMGSHWPLEKSNSHHSNASTKSSTSTPTASDDTQVTSYHVPDDVPINI